MTGALLFTRPIMNIFLAPGESHALGMEYLRYVCLSYLFAAVDVVYSNTLRATGQPKVTMFAGIASILTNTFLNYCLIYGNFGFPELGVRGAAIATLVSRCVELLIVIYYLKFREKQLHLTLKKLVLIDTSYIRDYIRVSFPVLLNQAQWGVAQMVQTGILGHLGGDVTAANAIAVQAYQVLSVVAYGAASAAGIVVGKTIGAGKQGELKKLVYTLEALFTVIGICSGLAIFLMRGPILMVFGGSLTENAYRFSLQFMAVIALTTVGTSYQMACDNGIIRGGGDTTFSAKMNLISMWLIVVPLSALAAFRWNCAPAVVFFLLKWDQLYKIIPVSIRLHSWKWVRVVTRNEDGELPETASKT
jgi:putative MATE family efflux protein